MCIVYFIYCPLCYGLDNNKILYILWCRNMNDELKYTPLGMAYGLQFPELRWSGGRFSNFWNLDNNQLLAFLHDILRCTDERDHCDFREAWGSHGEHKCLDMRTIATGSLPQDQGGPQLQPPDNGLATYVIPTPETVLHRGI